MKVSGYNFQQSLQNLKRLNRVYPDFYDFDTDQYNSSVLENPEETTEKLLNKYSPLTTMNSIEFIIAFFKQYGGQEKLVELYNDHYSDLLDMRHNPQSYSKMASLTPLRQVIVQNYTSYMGSVRSYTSFRNFLVLALIAFSLPLKGHQLVAIEFYKDPTVVQTLTYPIVLGFCSLENTFTFYFNKRKKKKLISHTTEQLKNTLVHSILLKYISTYRLTSNTKLVTASTGADITKSNISNCVLNLTNKLLNIQLTIQEINRLFSIS